MKQITELTNDYKQRLFPTLEDNSTFELNLRYVEQEQAWYFSLYYGNLKINNNRLVLSTNLLRQWENIIPFGIICLSNDLKNKEVDPFLLNDFSDGRVQLFIATKSELKELNV